ncbi:MAG: hypothetical protein R3Y08_01790 [Rikenellaceae bacterium]
MKFKFNFVALLMFLGLATVSCGDSSSSTVDPEEDLLTLDFECTETTHYSIVVSVDPGEYEGNYYMSLIETDQYTEYMGESDDPRVVADSLIANEMELGADLTIVDQRWVFSGVSEFDFSDINALQPSTTYYVCLFPIEGKSGDIIGNVTLREVATIDFPKSETMSFTTTISNTTATSTDVVVKVTDDSQKYLCGLYEANTVLRYRNCTDDYYHLMELILKSAPSSSYYKGSQSFSYETLDEDSNYAIVAFAVNEENSTPYSDMDINIFFTQRESSEPKGEMPELPDGLSDDFDIELKSVSSNDIVVKVDPKSYDEEVYVAVAIPYYQFAAYYGGKLDGFASNRVYQYIWSGMDITAPDGGYYSFIGAQDEIHLGKDGLMRPDTYYFISFFGVDVYKTLDTCVVTGVSGLIVSTEAE